LDIAARHGFGGVDVSIGEIANMIDQQGVAFVKDKFAAKKLRLGGMGCPVEFRQDEVKWRQGLTTLPRLAKAAAAIGCRRAATWIMPASDALDFKTNFDFHVTRLRPIAQILKDHGCSFGLEFVGPATSRKGKKFEFIWDMPWMLRLCDAIGTGNMGLLLDAWHWYTSHGTVEDLKKLKARQVVYVHVNDAPTGIAVDDQVDNVRRLPCETGVIDMASFLRVLNEIGYDGPITPEPFRKDLGALPSEEAAKLVAESLGKAWKVAGLA
jgi:sugar phosphate isomerase/epimerase